jgi:uncharacterized protein YukE
VLVPNVGALDIEQEEEQVGHAAVVAAVADEAEEVGMDLRVAVPGHWTGRAAESYQRSATNLATGVGRYAERVRGVARLLHQHEQEAAAIRTALAGGPVAV